MAPINLINVKCYTKYYSDNSVVTAKQAKEVFFLTTDDLKYLDYTRPKGWSAYSMGTGSCKLFNAHEVRRKAIRKLGSVSALIKKAEALNQRRLNKAERDEVKRQEERRRQQEAAAEAERKRIADLEAKKQARSEKKRQAEQQVKDAQSWRSLVKALDGTDVAILEDPTALSSLMRDIHDWKQQKSSMSAATTPKNIKKEKVALKEVSPN